MVAEMTEKTRRVLSVLLAALCFAVFTVLLFLPFPARVTLPEETYVCDFGDGTAVIGYQEGYAALAGIGETGDILLSVGGREGVVAAGDDMRREVHILREGELAELLSFTPRLNRLERAALFHFFGDRLYFDRYDFFAFTGENVKRCELREAREIVMLGGTLSSDALIASKAERLYLSPQSEMRYTTLLGADVEVIARAPYLTEGGAVLRDGVGGRRLVSGLPQAKIVDVSYDYADMSALLPCEQVERLCLPFCGSTPSSAGTEYHGELAYLFVRNGKYDVPETLTSVKITGGEIMHTAFYHCPSLREIDLCGIRAENISDHAFEGLGDLQILHCPRADVILNGEYLTIAAPCGCTVFTKVTN